MIRSGTSASAKTSWRPAASDAAFRTERVVRRPAPEAAAAWRFPQPSRPDCRTACPPDTSHPRGATVSMISSLPPYAPTGMPPPIILPRAGNVGIDAVSLLRPAELYAKPVMTSSNISRCAVSSAVSSAQSLQEALLWGHHAHVARDRLYDHARDVFLGKTSKCASTDDRSLNTARAACPERTTP